MQCLRAHAYAKGRGEHTAAAVTHTGDAVTGSACEKPGERAHSAAVPGV